MNGTSVAKVDLSVMLPHWVDAGIITDTQAGRIRADVAAIEAPPPRAPRGTPLVIEAMGYLGGVIVLVGLGLVTGQFWNELSPSVQFGLSAAVTTLLMLAGTGVARGEGGADARLRSVLWVAAAAALAASLALLAVNSFGWHGTEVLLFASGGTALAGAVMWALHQHILQQATVLAALLVTAAATAASLSDYYLAPMIAVWGLGTLWCLLAGFEVLRPRRAGMVLGAVAAIGGALSLEGVPWGTAVALLTVVALVAAAISLRDLVLLAVASIGTLAVLPPVVVQYFPGLLPAALTLIVVGLLLVGAAVHTARRQHARHL